MTLSSFNGAVMPICGVDALVVLVRPWVLADLYESQLFLFAFTTRFRRPVVLVAQGEKGISSYFGPGPLAQALAELPFELIPWQRYAYREPPVRNFMLPIPPEPEPKDSNYSAMDPRNESAIGGTLGGA